jgi:hypothetical protein
MLDPAADSLSSEHDREVGAALPNCGTYSAPPG